MKILITADLHYDITRSQEPARQVADQICSTRADALLVLGDVAGRDLQVAEDCLHLFDRFEGRKFFIAGNHDIWTYPGVCSLNRFENELPRVCAATGFHCLDVEPAEIDGVALVGSMGWYDYTMLPAEPGIPLRFCQAKIAPGAADRLGGYESLFESREDIPEWSMQIGTRWMDGQHVHLPMSDEAFCGKLLARFEAQLEWASRTCGRIIAGLHHVPFRELVPVFSDAAAVTERQRDPKWLFTAPYMGSERFGELLLRFPKVTHAYCGHTHFPLRTRRGSLECINVGCTYLAKCVEVLEIPSADPLPREEG